MPGGGPAAGSRLGLCEACACLLVRSLECAHLLRLLGLPPRTFLPRGLELGARPLHRGRVLRLQYQRLLLEGGLQVALLRGEGGVARSLRAQLALVEVLELLGGAHVRHLHQALPLVPLAAGHLARTAERLEPRGCLVRTRLCVLVRFLELPLRCRLGLVQPELRGARLVGERALQLAHRREPLAHL